MQEKYIYSLINKTLLDDFELKGGWSLNINDLKDASKLKFGTLVRKDNVNKLSIFQGFEKFSVKSCIYGKDSKKRYDKAFGVLDNNDVDYVELFNMILEESLFVPTIVHSHSVLIKYFAIINYHFKKKPEFNFLYLDFSGIDEWIKSLTHWTVKKADDCTTLSIVPNQTKPLSSFFFSNKLLRLSIYEDNRIKHPDTKNVNYSAKDLILIQSKDSLSDSQAISLSNEFYDLFSLVINENVKPKWVGLCNKENEHRDIYYQLYQPDLNIDDKVDDLFLFENFEKNKLFEKWFNKSDEYKLLEKDYFLTVRFKQTEENKLINLTEGIEAYFRNVKEKKKSGKRVSVNLLKKLKCFYLELPDFIKDEMENMNIDYDKWLNRVKTLEFILHMVIEEKE